MNKNNIISERIIIDKYLSKLHLNKIESYKFKNDAGYLKVPKNKILVVTNDTILENIDFFKSDPPESIANKIVTCNLSDVSSMGAKPYAYTLSLCIPKTTKNDWLKKFTKKLLILQNKYNFFLVGGDLSQSKKIIISSNFFGYVSKGKILQRTGSKINDDIWVTGNIGDSSIGLKILQKKFKTNKANKKYFLNKYLYPVHSPIGSKIINFASSAIDISDGFYGDLKKILKFKNYGASLSSKFIPFSYKTKKLIQRKIIDINMLLSSGDDYGLIFTSSTKNSSIIKKLAKKNNIKISWVGKIVQKKGIYLDDNKINIINKSYQHFS